MPETTANDYRKRLKTHIDRTILHHEILRVKRRNGENFVVLGEKDWTAIEETLYLNRTPGLVESICEAAGEPIEKGTPLEELDWRVGRVLLSGKAVKDAGKLKAAGLKPQTESLLNHLQENPFNSAPPFEKLVGNLKGFYSRRINIQHRIIYSVDKDLHAVHVLRMWTHYE